ncbi:MAG: ArsC/Spx/MgsR family protein [Streptococcus sp.]|nr:ArsC/Spx/MgsR family protein [Streptococcus sp.]
MKDKVKTASEDELLDILSSNGMLVKRPLLIKEDLVLIGFKEEEWAENLK